MNTQKIIHLTPPSFSPEHIKEKITCIRAHRERIFQVYSQLHSEKLVFHNYGHGGAGWTFLFGCVQKSVRDFEQMVTANPALRTKTISVVGAGCYGLLTAIMLRRKGYTVHIVAQEFEQIPSNKAAGFFFPRARKCSTQEERTIFETIGIESYKTYLSIARGEHAFIKVGPELLPAYFGLDIDPGFGPYCQQGIIEKPEKVTINFGNGKQYDVMEYKIIFMNSAKIMQELWRNIHELEIPCAQKTVGSFEEIHDALIFNCAGMGAKKLSGDLRIIPVQGHLITLKNQPDVEQLRYMINVKVVMVDAQGKARDELIYYAPKGEGILGITFIRGQDSESANQHEFDRLLERCNNFFGLNAAKI